MRWIMVLVMAMVVVACGSDGGEGEVRPFSEIQDSEFVFEADPMDAERAIFRVVTTEPSICAIVWGETEALGNFNNSLAMNGTGIVNHDVFLPGAIPGETYFFRVQGSTADGTLYQSELATFTVPELEGEVGSGGTMAEHGENLATGATVLDVSSEFSSAWAAANALDGDLTTEWSTAGDGDEAFIEIDLGTEQDLAGVEFITRSMADGTAITTTYFVIVDGGERLGPFPAGSPADPRFQPIEARGQIVRFEAEDTSGGNTGAIEIGVFAP